MAGGRKVEFSFLFYFLIPFYIFLSFPFNIGLNQANLTFLVFSFLFLSCSELRYVANLPAADRTILSISMHVHPSAHTSYLISFVLLTCILFQYSSYYCTALQGTSGHFTVLKFMYHRTLFSNSMGIIIITPVSRSKQTKTDFKAKSKHSAIR